MLQQIKLLKPPINPIQTQKQYAVPQNLSATSSHLIPKQCSKVSRRELALFTNSSLLLLLTSQTLDPFLVSKARAEEIPELIEPENNQVEPATVENSEASDMQNGSVEPGNNQVEPGNGSVEPATVENSEASDTQNGSVEPENNQVEPATVKNSEASDTENASVEPETNEIPQKIEVTTKRAFLDVSVAGKPAGRIIIRLNEENTPIGAARFSDLVSGRAGISFRRKEFVKIMPNYVQHGGVRSYGVDAELASKTGRSLTNERLVEEWERLNESPGTKNVAGTVSIIIRDPLKPPPKSKLVARNGKLVVDQEEVGVEPNGTEFTITTKDSPELDSLALVVGEVVEGMDVVENISQVKTVQENTSSPYFRVAKLIGDKRAVVAERGFNRPYSKVTVTNCGLLE